MVRRQHGAAANNHAFDYGEGGVLATIRHLEAAGIAHAGSGHNLAEARIPAISTPAAAASRSSPPPRPSGPGIRAAATAGHARPARHQSASASRRPIRSTATPSSTLQAMPEGLGFEQKRNRHRTHFFSDKEVPAMPAASCSCSTSASSAATASASRATPTRRISKTTCAGSGKRAGRPTGSWSTSTATNSRQERGLRRDPDRPEGAGRFRAGLRAPAIDAGADIFVGHGSHTPLGIEIYKGKPIFYSVGNLIFQNESVRSFPAVAYERFGLGHDATPSDFLDARTGNGKKGHVAHEGSGRISRRPATSSRQARGDPHPSDRPGLRRPRGQRGRPVLATARPRTGSLTRVDKLSKMYGVEVRNDKGVGVITVKGGGSGGPRGTRKSCFLCRAAAPRMLSNNMKGRFWMRSVGLLLGALLAALPSALQAQKSAPFYKDKQIRLIISAGVARGYMEYAPLLPIIWASILPAMRVSWSRACRAPADWNATNFLYTNAVQDGTLSAWCIRRFRCHRLGHPGGALRDDEIHLDRRL